MNDNDAEIMELVDEVRRCERAVQQAKNALEVFRPLNLMFFKYLGGLIVITLIKAVAERKFTIRKKTLYFS